MKNTVSRFCSVAFVQKPQTSPYTQYSSTNRLDALPSLADLERIHTIEIVPPTRSVILLRRRRAERLFFFPSTPVELSKTDQ